MNAAAEEWRKLGAHAVPAEERDAWVAQYFELLASGFAAQPLPSAEDVPKRGGRRKQTAAKNLLDELLRRAEQVLVFLDDLSILFTNYQAERDLRMVKVQQKIAGTFRSEDRATAFCRIRSYLSTMRLPRPCHVGCPGGCLGRQAFPGRLGHLSCYKAREDAIHRVPTSMSIPSCVTFPAMPVRHIQTTPGQ